MRSGQVSALARLLRACIFLTLVLRAGAAAADARVLCVDPHDPELVARIRGQSRDLPVSLQLIAAELSDPPTLTELDRAARAHGADFVVQVHAMTDEAQVIYVYDAGRHQLQVRSAPRPRRAARLSRSAAAETIALIVRGELRAALEAREQDRASDAPAPDGVAPIISTKREPEPEPSPAPVADPVPDLPDPGEHIATGAALSAGLRGSLPGDSRVFISPLVVVQWRAERVAVGIAASTSLLSRARHQGLIIDLHRHGLSAEVLWRGVFSPELELDLGANVGVSMYRRATRTSLAATWRTEAPKMPISGSLGPMAELRWSFTRSVGLSVRAGLDVLLSPLQFDAGAVDDDGARYEVSHLSRLEPWLALTLFVQQP